MTVTEFDSAQVKAFREARGWSQQQLAAEIGVDQATVSRMENGIEPRRALWILLTKVMAETPSPAPNSEAAE